MRQIAARVPEREQRGPSLPSRTSSGYTEARPELREALEIVWQRKWSIIGISVLLVGLAIFLSNRQTPIYESEAAVLVTPLDPEEDPAGVTELNVDTEREVAGSFAVAEVVAESLDIEASPRELLTGLDVSTPEDTEILEFTYSHSDPREAQRRAQAFASGYLEYRRQSINERIAGSGASLERELRTLNKQFAIVDRQLDRLPEDDPDRFSLELEAELLRGRILDRQLDRLALREDFTEGRVVQPADLPSEPVSPNHLANAGFALAAGLGLGIGLAFLRDRLSRRLRSDEEVEQQAGAPVLGAVPRIPSWRRRKQAYLVTRSEWSSTAAESYRFLRTNLLSAAGPYDAKTILITSAYLGEGKTATASNLAVTLARAGKRVVLVSADLRRPRLQQFFPTRGQAGLTEVLSGKVALSDALVRGQSARGSQENLSLVLSGKTTQDTSELLSSEAMLTVVQQLKEDFDFVIIDAPPVLPVTDATILARIVDGVLLVIGPRSLTRSTVSSTRQQLDKVGANVLGVLLNGTGLGIRSFYYTY
jgi:capsular exopolysaccharide synthesis family protein